MTPKIIALSLQATALLEAVAHLDDHGFFEVKMMGVVEKIIPGGPRHHRQLRERMLNDWSKLYNRIDNATKTEALRDIKIRPSGVVSPAFPEQSNAWTKCPPATVSYATEKKKKLTRCEAYQEQDEKVCIRCGIRWSIDEGVPLTAQCAT